MMLAGGRGRCSENPHSGKGALKYPGNVASILNPAAKAYVSLHVVYELGL